MVNVTCEKMNDREIKQNSHTHDRTPMESNEEDVVATIMEYILVQHYSLNQGLKIF